MRIGIKASPLTTMMAGIPSYLLNLLQGLARVDAGRNEYLLYTNRPVPFEIGLPDSFRFVKVRFPSPHLQLWYQLRLPGRLREDGVDLFHDPVLPMPFLMGVPGVVTVHDVSAYLFPSLHRLRSAMSARLLPLYLRKAREIIAVSSFTASEIERIMPSVAPKVTVIHQGVSGFFRPSDEADVLRVREKLGLPERFVLYLGTLEPRKNLPRLIRAFSHIADEVPHSLVIAGGKGWRVGKAVEIPSSLEDRVLLTGFVPGADLPALYSAAEVFAYPSLYEGFGLPVVEAMACGTPVLTSSVASLPEVAGDAALLVDPLSAEGMARVLKRLCEDDALRESLSSEGLERASLYSWDGCARAVLGVYESVAG